MVQKRVADINEDIMVRKGKWLLKKFEISELLEAQENRNEVKKNYNIL